MGRFQSSVHSTSPWPPGLNGLSRRDGTNKSGTQQKCHTVETHIRVGYPSDVPQSLEKVRTRHHANPTVSGNIFFFIMLKTDGLLCTIICVSCINTFPGLKDMRKGAVVNANFVVEAIYISKLLTFQSIIFQMPSGLCLSLDYL